MDHETAGDPVSGLKWTRRTTAKVADQLCALGIDVCPQTVARLLKAMGIRCASTTRSSPALPIRGATTSSGTSPNCASVAPPTTSRSSASIRRRRNSSARSAIPAPNGIAAPNGSRTTTSAPRPKASPSPTVSTTRGQCRDRLRRPNRRHPGVRRRLHREMVAHRGLQALFRGQSVADPGRRRRQQQ